MDALFQANSGGTQRVNALFKPADETAHNGSKTVNTHLPDRKQPTHGISRAGEEESQAKIERIANAMDNYVNAIQKDLQIKVHEETGRIVVKVLSKADGKVVREIPPEEMLDLAAKMEEISGILFNESV